jgi:hypothetical protein
MPKLTMLLRTSKSTKNVEFLNYLSFLYIYHQIPKFNVDLTLTKFTHLNHFSIGVIHRRTLFSHKENMAAPF